MNNRTLIICVAISVLLFQYGCKSRQNVAETQSDAEVPQAKLQLSEAQIKTNNMQLGQLVNYRFTRTVSATGYLKPLPKNVYSVSTIMGGTLKNLQLLPGARVVAGQQLCRIENPDFLQIQEDFVNAAEQLLYLKNDFDRQKELAAENVTAQKVFLKAQSDYLGTKARVEALKSKLKMLHINYENLPENMVTSIPLTAPISGYISKVEGVNGKFVSENDLILEIVESNPLLLTLQVFEKDILQIKEGQKVGFRLPDVADTQFEAQIISTGRTLEDTRTVTVTALFNPPANVRLVPGMYVRASIIADTFYASALPLKAMIKIDGNYFVLVKTNPEENTWTLEKRAVTTGYADNEMIEVLPESKLLPNDKIVIDGAFGL